jgi:hypothetical protein
MNNSTQPTVSSNVPPAKQPSTIVASQVPGFRLPGSATLEHAMKLAINEDRPIMMDYWKDSIEKTVLIGQRDDETKEKILVRSEEEYTSPISKIFKVAEELIVVTENSIYLVSSKIPTKKIS